MGNGMIIYFRYLSKQNPFWRRGLSGCRSYFLDKFTFTGFRGSVLFVMMGSVFDYPRKKKALGMGCGPGRESWECGYLTGTLGKKKKKKKRERERKEM